METRTVLHRVIAATAISLVASAANATPASADSGSDHAWLRQTLVARQAALTRAYNTCNLHALRASVFAGTTVARPGGHSVDPVIDARERVCGQLRREVVPGSLVVRAVGDDSALVSGRQRYCAVDGGACVAHGRRFVQLWTLDHGQWRMGWIRHTGVSHPASEASTAAVTIGP